MGSARVSNAKPIPMETTNRKSLKELIKSLFDKKKERPKIDKKETIEKKQNTKKDVKPIQNTNTVAAILENFDKLNLEDSKLVKEKKNLIDDDELNNFSFKTIEEPRNERIHSHSSEDSGYSDNKDTEKDKLESIEQREDSAEDLEKNEQTDDLVEDLEKLDLDDSRKKKKKLQTVFIPRGPVKHKVCGCPSSIGPYPTQEQDNYRQISQINKHTLTGGQVIVNQCQQPDNFSDFNIALESVQKKSEYLQNDGEIYLEDVMELIHEDTNKKSVSKSAYTPEYTVQDQMNTNIDYNIDKISMTNTYLVDFEEKTVQHNDLLQLLQDNYELPPEPIPNSIPEFGNEEFTQICNYYQKEFTNTSNDSFVSAEFTYATPPPSETVPSPMSASSASLYPSNSEYTLSPGRSPIYNCDYENYQEIPHFEEEKDTTDKKTRERTASISSMSMKNFKDMQKEIVYNFSKMDCCQMTRKSCKEIFQEHLQKIKIAVRKNLCMGVAKLDLKEACGVLHSILINLSNGNDKEDIQYALFGLVCDRMLAQEPGLFFGDGLRILKSAALRCPHRPLLTRYLVQCIRTAIEADHTLVAGREHIFHEVDALGDNLVIACARAGDRCSSVLSELVRARDGQPPLFRTHHTNADGYTALHVACSQHSAASPRLHTVHVLLVHAGFDITEGDVKGGDTALHLAVNSANCDLQLILLMFKQVDRKDWKSLAHCPNLSTKTPIDLARLATKTPTRQNYPQEVLEFLKKCR